MGRITEILTNRYHELVDWRAKSPHIPFVQRLRHFTWSWFAVTMATGGIGLVIGTLPYRFYGLNTIGKIVYILDIFLLALFCSLMIARFIIYHDTFMGSWRHFQEKFFIATCLLSFSTFIDMFAVYAKPSTGEWMVWVIRIYYYIYIAVTFLYGIFAYYTVFRDHVFTLETAAPSWILPIFPCMIGGVIAGAVLTTQPSPQMKNMVIVGIMFQGLGFWVYLMTFSVMLLRLFTVGFPAASERPAMFILTGPPGFTGLALINLARGAVATRPNIFRSPHSSEYFEFVSTFLAIFIWGLGAWIWCLCLVTLLAGIFSHAPMKFSNTWFALIFSNVGFVILTCRIGEEIDSKAFTLFGHIISVALCIVWLILMYLMIRAFLVNDIMYPGKDEDAKKPAETRTMAVEPERFGIPKDLSEHELDLASANRHATEDHRDQEPPTVATTRQ
ncbi:plasma membrane malate/succinate:proton symporter Mae1 [Schizosaccharomyces osmophilus]|uniref:Plasma membrane malate/succinate:proton symporter Mae1 n=1 Tax=Schizosaccharomyces osmophilus TaxID=2545709 RepID=A0AAE9WCR1_9SCHI|nr:plasma membrane malate/succinate:proton symporter Mae1 [Schizosaccharomyces osmophilus]WBW73770.1 plasma membrane malate/succinate:proton symporter Mae1 [Schizosaccharomyces osmophilus]